MDRYTEMLMYSHRPADEKFELLKCEMLPTLREIQKRLLHVEGMLPDELFDVVHIVHFNAVHIKSLISRFPEQLCSQSEMTMTNEYFRGLRHDIIAPVTALYYAAHIIKHQCVDIIPEEMMQDIHQMVEMGADLVVVLEGLMGLSMPEMLT